MTLLRIHGTMARSRANGPGVRAVVWVQGCTLGCPGCFNPDTHAPGGYPVRVAALIDWCAALRCSAAPIDGLSVSGGEPLQQAEGTLALLAGARRIGLTTIVWTGYTPDEIAAMPCAGDLFEVADLVIAGRFDARQRLAAGLRGSRNKVVLVGTAPRLAPADLAAVPTAEIVIDPRRGSITVTGMAGPVRRTGGRP